MSMEQEAKISLDHALFLWMKEEEIVLINNASTSSTKMPQV